jgi:glycosyltransferase involved in cell wall biosynthesis
MVSKSNNRSLAVIIPMYNEEVGAQRCVERVVAEMKKLPVSSRLIVVNDGSKDKTEFILKELNKEYGTNLVVVTHPHNRGYGAGLITGIKTAVKLGYKFGIMMDSDLTNDPKYLIDFVKAMDDEVDCVKASRYIKGGKMEGVPLKRQLISRWGNMIAALLFNVGVKDCSNGFRMVRLSLEKKIDFKENNFAMIMEEMYYLKKMGANFKEIPNTLTSRVDTDTNFRYTPSIFWDYLKYPLKSVFI